MKYIPFAVIAVLLAVRLRSFLRRRSSAGSGELAAKARDEGTGPVSPRAGTRRAARAWSLFDSLGDVGKIARREIRERVRGRIFRFGTLAILLAVGAAIVIPTLHGHNGATSTAQRVGVVGALSPVAEKVVYLAGSSNGDVVDLLHEPSLAAATAGLRKGTLDLVVVGGERILLDRPATAKGSSADPSFVQSVASYLGALQAYGRAGISAAQATQALRARPVPVQSLRAGSKGNVNAPSVIGLVLLFFMLTQYDTWVLIGVMQEKSSRVVEVLLATVRPIELLGGKVLGIGLLALGQAALIVGFALAVGAAAGSDLLHGTAQLLLLAELLWLVLGYAFYCWVYAAAGSTAERQDQVQTLALPLSIPVLLGYVFSITVVSSGSPDPFFEILAYLPPTAPFCMTALVALGDVAWWQFLVSVLITIAATAAMAVFAARIYRRAVLRTGGRVRLRELVGRGAG